MNNSNNRSLHGTNQKHRTGTTAVEFAMIAPLIFLFVFGGIELVRGNMVRHTANNAAYEAARKVIAPGANRDEAIAVAERILAIAGINGATITIEPSNITEDTTFVSAAIDIPLDKNSWGIGRLLLGETMSSNVELRTERSPGIQAQNLPTVLDPPPPPPAPPAKEPPASEPGGEPGTGLEKTGPEPEPKPAAPAPTPSRTPAPAPKPPAAPKVLL